MSERPPSELDGARVLLFTPIDERHVPTGACRHTVGGAELGAAAGLAICTYDDADEVYLFYCDACWRVLTDTFHVTVADAKAQAEFEYRGTTETWESP